MFGVSIIPSSHLRLQFYCFIDRHAQLYRFLKGCLSNFIKTVDTSHKKYKKLSSIYRNKYTCARCSKQVQHRKKHLSPLFGVMLGK